MDILKVIREIENALTEMLKSEDGWSDKQWTEQIKKAICEVGRIFNYGICASGCCGSHDGEWLYDMVWLEYNGDKYLINSAMVLECEWNMNEDAIFYDFEKLLLARAGLRVLIFQQTSKAAGDAMIANLKKSVQNFTLSKDFDNYLFASFIVDEERFIFFPYTFMKAADLAS